MGRGRAEAGPSISAVSERRYSFSKADHPRARKSQDVSYRITGAILALAGCVLGNFFTIIGFVSQRGDDGFFGTLSQIDYAAVPSIMASTASPMDFLFYAIAVYEGFKLSVKS